MDRSDAPETRDHEYDVCLSFAGEQRSYVEEVAAGLRARRIKVFYADYERNRLWGKDMYEYLDFVYRTAARYCAIFVSKDYARKMWPTHERKSAQARALESGEEYILPVRFDDTELPGLRKTVHYLDARHTSPYELVEAISHKLGPRTLPNYLPPVPDRLYAALDATTERQQEIARYIAGSFFEALRMMNVEERRLVAQIFDLGCWTQLPDNVHISLDIVRRDLGLSPPRTLEMLGGLVSLGFEHEQRSDPEEGDDLVVVRWSDPMNYADEEVNDYAMENSTAVAVKMLDCGRGHEGCSECAKSCIEHLDFVNLSSI